MGVLIVVCFCCMSLYVHSSFAITCLEERAGCFAWFVFLVSRDGCVTLSLAVSWVCLQFVVFPDLTHYFIV